MNVEIFMHHVLEELDSLLREKMMLNIWKKKQLKMKLRVVTCGSVYTVENQPVWCNDSGVCSSVTRFSSTSYVSGMLSHFNQAQF